MLEAFPAIKLPREFSVLRTRWGADPLHRGSYSYVSARSSTSDVETLAEPLVGCLLLPAAIILLVLNRAHKMESRRPPKPLQDWLLVAECAHRL